MNKKILTIAGITLLIDQISKTIVESFMKMGDIKQIIDNFFYITICHNEGVAWGLLSGCQWIITLLTFVAIIMIYRFIYCFKSNTRNNIAFGLLIGGLAGNLIDRLIFGYVRDFLDFYLFHYDYPVFNIADIGIVVGTILLMFAVLKGEDKVETSSKRKHKSS